MSIVESALGKMKAEALPADSTTATQERVQRPNAVVEAGFATRPLLEMPLGRMRSLGIAPPELDERRQMSEYRAIKRSLLAPMSQRSNQPLGTGNVVMIASAVPGEGKTYTSFNLAMSLATERDWLTVLVDADCARQHLSDGLGLTGKPGLLDVLSGSQRSLTDVMYRTSVSHLFVVPAGSSSENATELMASARMTTIVQDLLRSNPKIILLFDSSPILQTPESRALADAVGQIVLVVRADHTSRADVQEALAILGDGHKIGVVLNQFRGSTPQASYYGNYPQAAGSV